MKNSVVVIGMGEMGSVFARGFLKAGYPVIPVRRQDDIQDLAKSITTPELVLVAVGEKELPDILQNIPANWHHLLALLQNELLPQDWQQNNFHNPTVISVWFEKKAGMDSKVLVPSPVFGPKSQLMHEALATLDLPVDIVLQQDTMLFELVRKNMYILTINICGLVTAGNVNQLRNEHASLMNKVFDDILTIQQHLSGHQFDRQKLWQSVLTAFDGDPEHICMGRTAPQRLQRALKIAQQSGLNTPELERIQAMI